VPTLTSTTDRAWVVSHTGTCTCRCSVNTNSVSCSVSEIIARQSSNLFSQFRGPQASAYTLATGSGNSAPNWIWIPT